MSSNGGATGSSLTDVMASLMAIFVLLFVAAQNNRGAGMKTARDVIIQQLRGELVKAGIDQAAVDSVPNDLSTVIIVLPDSVLFERGKSQMADAGRQVVRSATPLLAGVLCANNVKNLVDQLVVEGHTDNTIPWAMPPQEGRRYNLELSQRRSMDFVSTSTRALEGYPLLECYLGLVSATGRGQENPLPNIAANAALQRRVVLRIRLRTNARSSTMMIGGKGQG